ncbi:MAG: Hpt domain-containing protein [Gammaproteobacteria bacterium]|nr:Hpt domain-containing protein [Gammaproteobacteria bacterium]
MATTSSVDLGTLGWVKEEIDETLKRARQALEAFTENRADDARLRLCATYLHQIAGTLKMVEFDNLADFVSEAEALAEALLAGAEAPSPARLEPLVRFILSMPDVLEAAQTRRGALAQMCLPLLNDLRVARGLPAADMFALFSPNLDVRPPRSSVTNEAVLGRIFLERRAGFQAVLVQWLKTGDAALLTQMKSYLVDWREHAAFLPAAQCLWIAAGFIGVVRAETTPLLEHKKLFGRLDQQLKRGADGQDKASARATYERLSREMLFAISQSGASDPDTDVIREAFGLTVAAEVYPVAAIDALRSVTSALEHEVRRAQEFLSSYFDAGDGGQQIADKLISLLDKMSKTFTTLNIEPLRALTADLRDLCGALKEGRIERSSAAAMALAQALLQVESAVHEIPTGRVEWQAHVNERRRSLQTLYAAPDDTSGIEISETTLSEYEMRRLAGSVGAEIRVNLQHMEAQFTGFAADGRDLALLEGLPKLAGQVTAAFRVLGDEAAADVAQGLSRLLERLAAGALAPSAGRFEAVAIGVGALEAQVTGLERGRALPPERLSAVSASLQKALEAEEIPAGLAGSGGAPGSAASAARPSIDPEILPVFLEDAHEALRQLTENMPRWRERRDDEEAVTVVRRAFHTLKGSGRMVEAGEIAELAYDAETLMNRVRARQLVSTDDIVHWIGLAHDCVQRWVDAVEQDGSLPEMGGVRAALQALANNQQVPAAAPAPVESSGATGQSVAADAPLAPQGAEPDHDTSLSVIEPKGALAPADAPLADTPDAGPAGGPQAAEDDRSSSGIKGSGSTGSTSILDHDPLLRDIFVTEMRDHLQVLQAAALEGKGSPVSAALLRAAHTLHGSARSVALLAMADSGAALERYLQAMASQDEVLDADATAILAAFTDLMTRLLVDLQEAPLRNELAALEERLEGLVAVRASDRPLTWWQEKDSGLSEADNAAGAEQIAVTGSASLPPLMPEITVRAQDTQNIDPELREIFRDEARDLLEALGAALTMWRSEPSNDHHLSDLKRVLHTLKGAARMAGAVTVGEVSHATEDLLRRVEDGSVGRDGRLMDVLDEAVGRLEDLYQAFIDKRPPADVDRERHLLSELAQTPQDAVPVPVGGSTQEPDEEVFRPDTTSQVRVKTALLDRLVNYAGEVSIARSRMEQQIFRLREHLAEMSGNVMRFRDQVRELEIQAESQIGYRVAVGEGSSTADFDPLEFDRYTKLQQLTRGLTENVHDLITLHGTLDGVAGQAEAVLQQQARVNTELQEGLMRTRMVSFATQAHRLRQIVRQTAQELGKKAELVLSGAEVELDRHLLERMIGPFEHMVRNALDHGLEPTAERVRLGKPPVGAIRIDTLHESGEIVIRFSDDGQGLNVERIRAKAIERKLMPADAVLGEEQIVQFILLPGFSTASAITHLSGRGVGMDVVHNEVKKLGGAITVETRKGLGTTFVIRLPLTLSITQALMVGCGDQTFAIPLAAIVNIVEAPNSAIQDTLGMPKPMLRYGGQDYPFMDLSQRLGIAAPPLGAQRKVPVLLLRLDNREVAVAIGTLFGTREVVVKPLGPQLAEIRGLLGATILGDGRVVLILDVPGLWVDEDIMKVVPVVAVPEVVQQRRRVVLVVDDSLTVRKVTSRFLQKQGYDVMTAKDGVDALEQLRERTADIMLVDIEMPRMDGYEFTTRVRTDEQLRHVPIIMITSRSGAKHRERALSLGVDVYLGKPYQEDDVCRHIETLLQRGHT